MIRVLIADDHAILRRGLADIISETKDMQVCGEAESGAQTIARAPAPARWCCSISPCRTAMAWTR